MSPSMQTLLCLFFAVLSPLPATALVKTGLRTQGAISDKSDAGMASQWWPFPFGGGGGGGGGGVKKGTYKEKLENVGDTQYFGVIEVGGQKIKAIIDTGSFELVVFGANCSICGAAEDLYNNSKSSTGVSVDFEATHTYGSGTVYSKQAVDNLKIGPFAIDNQSFWEVYDADMYILSEGLFQAIFGVGPPRSAIDFAKDDAVEVHKEVKDMEDDGEKITKKIKDIVNHYDDMVDLERNITSVAENLRVNNMSICLGQESKSPGFYVWDDHAAEEEPEKFVSVEVNGEYYWSTPLGDVHLAGASLHGGNVSKKLIKLANESVDLGCKYKKCSAIVDTGTSLLVAPSNVVDAVYDLADAWDAAGGTCEDLSALPELRFTLGGLDFSLPPEAYMGEVSGDSYDDLRKYMPRFYDRQQKRKHLRSLKKKEMKKKQNRDGDTDEEDVSEDDDDDDWTMCEPLIMSMDADSQAGELWILGMPFFRKYYTSFRFIQKSDSKPWLKMPQAGTMSFSEQDGKCNPGTRPTVNHPQWVEQHSETKVKSKAKSNSDSSDTSWTRLQVPTKRRAQLKVDTSRILVPNLMKRVERLMHLSKKSRPFVRI